MDRPSEYGRVCRDIGGRKRNINEQEKSSSSVDHNCGNSNAGGSSHAGRFDGHHKKEPPNGGLVVFLVK
ncbi:MAG: hypothetical protein KAQ87_03730 [Candidatus Pacebacteria bacterium]|nr:hypothetical protein [Candidatus Paceibacterota bacterium]